MCLSRVEVSCESCYCEDKANISHSVINYGLEGGSIGVSASVSPADKQEGYNSDPLSADEDLEYVVGRHQNHHCDQENKQVLKEAVHLGVRMYIPGCKLQNRPCDIKGNRCEDN